MNAMPGIFWYWNADPTPNGIRRQLTQIRAAGFRSVYLHPMPDNFRKSDFKSGMKMRYLGRKFFRLARTAVDECRRLGLRFMIYDEGGWPSGTANGELVKRRRNSAFTFWSAAPTAASHRATQGSIAATPTS